MSRILAEQVPAAYANADAHTRAYDSRRIVVLNFRALQLLRIQSLQQELFRLQFAFKIIASTDAGYWGKLIELDTALASYGMTPLEQSSNV